MSGRKNWLFVPCTLSACLLCLGVGCPAAEPESPDIDFNRDIRPILSDKCFACHGADAANQDSPLRLDSFDKATEDLGGYAGIVPGDVDASEVYLRVMSDGDDVMPPAESNRTLTNREKQLLTAWIQSGAEYKKHWSFVPPSRPELPALSAGSQQWARNPIDYFIAARLEKEGISPSDEADLELLMRRAALTLTGLPPEPNDLNKARGADDDQAYQYYVDQLLGSMDYAERQALRWLDAARYADTDGYQNDAERKNWPWRDWVIKAFHDNMPFDRFTVEQLAGDMLPEANESAVLASAFNRNHRQNAEGGALAAEFYVENVIDRVETTSTVWLGLTTGCARCHDHKFDPISQREFFQLFAYFNNIGEKGIGKGLQAQPTQEMRSPLVETPPELENELTTAKRLQQEARDTLRARAIAWAEGAKQDANSDSGWASAQVVQAEATNGVTLKRLPDGSWLAGGKSTTNTEYDIVIDTASRITGLALEALPHESFRKPLGLAPSSNGNFVLTGVEIEAKTADDSTEPTPVDIASAVASFEQSGYPAKRAIDGRPETGWAVFGANATSPVPTVRLVLGFNEPVDLAPGSTLRVTLKHQSQFANHHVGRFRVLATSRDEPRLQPPASVPPEIAEAVALEPSQRTEEQIKAIVQHFETIDPKLKQTASRLAKVEGRLEAIGATGQPVMVMRERTGKPNPAYLLDRGQYDSPDKSEVLPRAIPATLASAAVAASPPQDRLELAQWMVSRENPLTARVIVNRIWRNHFGVGIVKTVEDFGSQGEYPSHPALLDWLAVEFIESGWNVKALNRLIVSSATYRQRSTSTPETLARDPQNRLLSRGPRYRMDGFSIRDAALQAAGILNTQVGGPPVKPYQPGGLWESLAANKGTRYLPSKGNDLYRKSLYTYWKRAVNPPRQLIFDAGGREACNVYIRRTNTPLQALALMNDVTFIEAARNVAQRAMEKTDQDTERLETIYRLVTARQPTEATRMVLADNLAFFQAHYGGRPAAAKSLVSQGESARDESLPIAEHAAWTAVAHLILNLDETISVE